MNVPGKMILKLYVIEKSPGTIDMVKNLKSLLDTGLKQSYSIEIIDILANPEIVVQDKILASPTLIKTLPLPEKRIVGKLLYSNLIEELCF
jgi:circadian clock protein KaiB